MIITLKQFIDERDVHLATLRTYRPFSDISISVADLSYNDENNTTPSFLVELEVVPDNHILNITADMIDNIMLTNEVMYDFKTSREEKLWFTYTCKQPFYPDNILKTTKEFIVDLRNYSGTTYIIRGLITQNETIIVRNTAVVEWSVNGSPYAELSKDKYILDPARGTVLMHTFPTQWITYGKVKIRVKYDIVQTSLILNRDRWEYRFDLYELDAEAGSYILHILTVNDVVYSFEYNSKTIDNRNVIVNENIIPTGLFNLVPYFNLSRIDSPHIFAVQGDEIHVKGSNSAYKYYMIHRKPRSSRIVLQQPIGYSIDEQWYLSVTKSSFISSEGLTYSTENLSSNNISSIYENALVTGKHSITLRNKPIVNTLQNGTLYGLKLLRNNSELHIESIDIATKQVTVVEELRIYDTITAIYKFEADSIVLSNYNINPSQQFANVNMDIYNYYMVVIIAPLEQLKDINGECVFVTYLPKRDSRNAFLTYSNEQLLSMLETNIFKQSFNTGSKLSVPIQNFKPYLLGMIAIEDTYNPSVATIYDGRMRGGGVPVGIEGEVYQDIRNNIFHMFDIAVWDGELMDVAGILVVRIPNSILYRLQERIMSYDFETQMVDSSERSAYALTKAKTYIDELISISKTVGKKVIVEYING